MHNKNRQFIDKVGFSAYEKPGLKANFLFLCVLVFLASMMVWVAFSSIDEIVKGQGKIIPSSRIQNIQSVDGGTIEKISVKEGTFVKKGDELIIIDDVRFNASVDELKNDLYSYKTQLIRLKAQSAIKDIKQIPRLSFPINWKKDASTYIKSEKLYYKNKINELKSLMSVETSKYKQKKQEHKEIKRKITKLRSSKNNIKKQLKITTQGVKDGVMSKIDELKLKKEYSETVGELEIAELALKRSKTAIKESRENIKQQLDIFKSEASKELNKVETEINKIDAKLTYSNDRVEKSVIYSPVDGVVNHIYFTTLGGVVKEADVLMDIVPTDDSLLVEAKIDPKDIGFISGNNSVTVKVTAYDFAIYGGLKGTIEQIGADSIFDEETKKYFYMILVRTDKNYLGTKEKPLAIIPGMVSEVDIKTGKKTILKYLLKPIAKTIQNSMTER
jgi:adhesin transport system membrane fusion protein